MCEDEKDELNLPEDPEPMMLHETFTSTEKEKPDSKKCNDKE